MSDTIPIIGILFDEGERASKHKVPANKVFCLLSSSELYKLSL